MGPLRFKGGRSVSINWVARLLAFINFLRKYAVRLKELPANRVWRHLRFRRFQEAFQLPDARRVPHFPQRFGFNLPNPFASNAKLPTHLFERSAVAIHQSKPLLEHLPLAFCQGL